MDDVRWLDEDEQQAWRGLITGTAAMERRLERELLAQFDLSMDDYAILVLLSEAPERRRRMSWLADSSLVARPQVTYRVRRLEERGIVAKVPDPEDGRGMWAQLTDEGYALLTEAAKLHVTNVRELVLDAMDRDEFLALGAAMEKVYRHIADDDCAEARRA